MISTYIYPDFLRHKTDTELQYKLFDEKHFTYKKTQKPS